MLSRSRAAAGVEQLPSTFVNVRVVANFNLSDCCKRGGSSCAEEGMWNGGERKINAKPPLQEAIDVCSTAV